MIEALWRRYSGGAEAMRREQYAELRKEAGYKGYEDVTDEVWAKDLGRLEDSSMACRVIRGRLSSTSWWSGEVTQR